MEMENAITSSVYFRRFGHLQFHVSDSDSNPPAKKPKFSPTESIETSGSLSNMSMFPPLPQNCNYTLKQSPMIRFLLRCRKKNNKNKKRSLTPLNNNMRKKKSVSIEEITKAAFDSAVQSSSTTDDDGGVKKSSSWVKSRLLGKGAYGSVYLATSQDKTERAIKTAEVSKASSLIDEGKILRRFQSMFVVRCYGDEMVQEGSHHRYNLVLEYCSGQSLADLILNTKGGLLECDVKLFAKDILSGLSYIHDRDIIHCDIKPDNILLKPVDYRFRMNGYLTKLGDFGLAMEKGSSEYGNGSGHKRGTTRYMAPEVISSGNVDFSADVWSFGCTVLEMLTGRLVWKEYGRLGSEDWVNLIGYSSLVPDMPTCLSEEALDFLRVCLDKDPVTRWKKDELMEHPFLRSDEEFSHNGFVYD